MHVFMGTKPEQDAQGSALLKRCCRLKKGQGSRQGGALKERQKLDRSGAAPAGLGVSSRGVRGSHLSG